MRLRVSGRSSDLSRIQIHQVANAFRSAVPDIEIVPHFRESLGDKMQHDPLWSMPEKGVFTEDFVEDLKEGRTDLVVHSWKDLPTEPREGTEVVGTLPRADTRDVLLMRRDRWSEVEPGSAISVLSSSPRRVHNLTPFLAWALPVPRLTVEFVPVRGNVPTRIRKLINGEHHGLIVAKAALDRLLTSTADEFSSMREEVRSNLNLCHWMVLPISENPTGAAQGALAMEVSTAGDSDVIRVIGSMNDEITFSDATRERQILRSYGGGCHQKIGVTVLTRPYGTLVSLRGQTDEGETLDRFELERDRKAPTAAPDKIWPTDTAEANWLGREPLDVPQPDSDSGYWVARADALPASWEVDASRPVWTAGLRTWKKLAERGIWVNGSAEGLGEDEDPRTDVLADGRINWIKLTHDRAEAEQGLERLATYRLISDGEPPDLSAYTHFFWTSGSRFLEAIERQPSIASGWHACGPGNTHKIIREKLGSDDRIDVLLSHEEWLKDITQ